MSWSQAAVQVLYQNILIPVSWFFNVYKLNMHYPLVSLSYLECTISVGGKKNMECSLTCTGAKTAQNLFLTHYYFVHFVWTVETYTSISSVR